MGLIKNLVMQGKDKAMSRTIEVFGEPIISRYGTLIDLRCDSHACRIELEVLLKGETTPIRITVNHYEIIPEGDTFYITCSEVTVSREWISILAEDLIKGRKFEVPSKYAKLLNIIV